MASECGVLVLVMNTPHYFFLKGVVALAAYAERDGNGVTAISGDTN